MSTNTSLFSFICKKTPKVSLCNTEIIPRFDCHSSIVLFGPWKYLQILQDVKSIQNHFWIKGITILNLSFCNDMMKNERLCYALKKEIWFLENAMVINVRKLFGVFRFLKINVSNVNVVTYCKQYFPRQKYSFQDVSYFDNTKYIIRR